jgi:hypothetical protein
MSRLKQKINKLYYGKWPFKIECDLTTSSLIIRLGPEGTRHWATHDTNTWFKSSKHEKDCVLEFLDVVEPYLDKELQIRTEGSHFNFFCKDRDLKDAIVKDVGKWLKAVDGPESDEELEFMLASGRKKVICSNLPYGKYRYKINLRPNMLIDARPKFLEWAKKYGDSVSIADSTNRWLAGKHSYVQAPFIYIEDEKTLAMFGLFLGNNIRIVEEFILRSSINISLDQETPCQHLVKV